MNKLQIKRFLEEPHTIEEHLTKIYSLLFELSEELEELKETKEVENNDKIKIRLLR